MRTVLLLIFFMYILNAWIDAPNATRSDVDVYKVYRRLALGTLPGSPSCLKRRR